MWFIKKLGSVYFAVFLCAFLLLLFILSTSLESLWGTAFAQKTFYQTRWFDLLLSLLWINIFCAALARFPFQKSHAGFLITHIGILGLLFGALLTRFFGLEGQVLLYEGERSSAMSSGGRQWMVTSANQNHQFLEIREGTSTIPMHLGKFNEDSSLCPLTPQATAQDQAAKIKEPAVSLNISVLKIMENAHRKTVVTEGKAGAPLNYAIHLNLKSPKAGLDETLWLVEHDLTNEHPPIQFLGPLRVTLQRAKEKKTVTNPYLCISTSSGEELVNINLAESIPQEIQGKDGAFHAANVHYFPHALVNGNQLINEPKAPFNPAVEFDLIDNKGNQEHYIHFGLYPDFESIHGKSTERLFNVAVDLNTPESDSNDSYDGSSLIFTVTKEGGLLYRIESKNDSLAKNEAAQAGENYPTGWMDIEFNVESFFKHAQTDTQVVGADKKSSSSVEGKYAAQFSLKDGQEERTDWLMEGEEVQLSFPEGDVRLALVEEHKPLPFSLILKDFRKVDYPGTNNPASYESDVLLEDAKDKVKIEKTISMNKPLDYKGYRIFQSSYIQDPNYGEASVFTVAKNPGISFIYLSSCIIFLGASFQFFLKGNKPKEGESV